MTLRQNKILIGIFVQAFILSSLKSQVIDFRENLIGDTTSFINSPKFSYSFENYTNHVECLKHTLANKGEEIKDSRYIDLLNLVGEYSEVFDLYKQKSKKINSSLHKYNLDTNDIIQFDEILSQSKKSRILIVNEEHHRIESRATILGLLPYIKENGFTHFTMESIQNTKNNGYIGIDNGYYLTEPVNSEILRYAIELGFKVIKYDTFSPNIATRDSLQAYNLVQNFFKTNDTGKIFVIAGQSHGCDDCPGAPLMGMILKMMYNIDPTTIDFTRGCQYCNKGDINFESIIQNKGFFLNSESIKNSMGFSMFDYFYIYPKFDNLNRPNWLLCGGQKSKYLLRCLNKNAALVQLYYKDEFVKDMGKFATPADINYKTNKDGYFEFYLRPNKNYIEVYRNEFNKIVFTQDYSTFTY